MIPRPLRTTFTAPAASRVLTLTLLVCVAASCDLRAEDHPTPEPESASVHPAADSAPVESHEVAAPVVADHGTDEAPVTEREKPAAETPAPAHVEAKADLPEHPPAAVSHAAPKSRRVAPASMTAKEAQGLCNLGTNLTDRNDFDAAQIAYRQVLNGKAPVESTKSALLGLARMHRKKGELTKAAAIYQRFLKDYPSDDRLPDALLDLGRTLREMGAPSLAIASFYNVINSTLKLPTESGFEHYQLLAKTAQFEVAETHFQSGNFAEANKFFSRLRMLDLAPADRARAHFKASFALQLSGDLEPAVASLRAYLDQWPDDENVPEARYLLATSLRSLRRSQEALTATIDLLMTQKQRTAADPKRWMYWQRRTGNQLANEFFQTGDIVNALAIYRGLAGLSDEPSWRLPVAYQVALCYERLGDTERASTAYRDIVATAEKNPSAEITDIARMANSRLAHVSWRAATDGQVAALFDSTTGKTEDAPAKTQLPDDSDRSPAPAPTPL